VAPHSSKGLGNKTTQLGDLRLEGATRGGLSPSVEGIFSTLQVKPSKDQWDDSTHRPSPGLSLVSLPKLSPPAEVAKGASPLHERAGVQQARSWPSEAVAECVVRWSTGHLEARAGRDLQQHWRALREKKQVMPTYPRRYGRVGKILGSSAALDEFALQSQARILMHKYPPLRLLVRRPAAAPARSLCCHQVLPLRYPSRPHRKVPKACPVSIRQCLS
jgi:hypothetical protein